MKRALFLSAFLVPALAIVACSGSILPVVQDNGDSGASSSSSGASGHNGSSSGASSGSSGTSTSSSGGSSGSSTSGSGGSSGGTCPADAGGNNCFCGDLICQNGAWVCGPCTPDAGATTCEPPCKSGDVCVKDQVVGGAVIPPDGGVCPPGRHVNGDRCEQDPTFMCMPDPCNGAALTCGCAAVLCQSQQSCPYQCDSTNPGQVNCVCPVP